MSKPTDQCIATVLSYVVARRDAGTNVVRYQEQTAAVCDVAYQTV